MTALYCDRDDVETVYGKLAVEKWADLDNQKDEKFIDKRITWAIRRGSIIINARLNGGPYAIPFAVPYPEDIIDLAALQSGIVLFDGRRVYDTSDPDDQVSAQREEVETIINQIRAGQYTIPGLQYSGRHPFVVNSDPEIVIRLRNGYIAPAGVNDPAGTSFRTVRERFRDGTTHT